MFLKTVGLLCSVLFRKEKRTQGPRNHWVDTTTCLIHFITGKHHLWKRDKMLIDFFFLFFLFFFFLFKHSVSLCLNDPVFP